MIASAIPDSVSSVPSVLVRWLRRATWRSRPAARSPSAPSTTRSERTRAGRRATPRPAITRLVDRLRPVGRHRCHGPGRGGDAVRPLRHARSAAGPCREVARADRTIAFLPAAWITTSCWRRPVRARDERVGDPEQRGAGDQKQAPYRIGQPRPQREPRGRRRSDPVAGTWDRLDQGRVAELAPQPADRHLDDVAERVDGVVPGALEQLLGRDHGAVGRQQDLQDGELLDAQLELAPVAPDGPPAGVEIQVAVDEDRRQRRLCAAGERPDPRDELGERERLGKIIVRAEPEPVDAVRDRRPRRSASGPARVRRSGQPLADAVAVQPRQVAVEHDHVVVVDGGLRERRWRRRMRDRPPCPRGAGRRRRSRQAPRDLRRQAPACSIQVWRPQPAEDERSRVTPRLPWLFPQRNPPRRYHSSMRRIAPAAVAAVLVASAVSACGGSSTPATTTTASAAQTAAIAFSKCMRANGVPNFPDLGAGSGGFRISATRNRSGSGASIEVERRTGQRPSLPVGDAEVPQGPPEATAALVGPDQRSSGPAPSRWRSACAATVSRTSPIR